MLNRGTSKENRDPLGYLILYWISSSLCLYLLLPFHSFTFKSFQKKYRLIDNMYVLDVKCPLLFSCINVCIKCSFSWQTLGLSCSRCCPWSLCKLARCIGCECHGLPGAILPEGFEVMRPIEADLSVLEILSYSVWALKVCLFGC